MYQNNLYKWFPNIKIGKQKILISRNKGVLDTYENLRD